MRRILTALAAIVGAGAVAVAAMLLAPGAALAGDETATQPPTETVEPTATAAPGTYIAIEVVHDLNKDGVRQASEPGVEGVSLHGGCSDAIIIITPTDADGETQLDVSGYLGRVDVCISLQHRFGWLSTTDPTLQLGFPVGEQHTAVFLVHDLGADVMEVYGEAILAGVPAPEAAIALSAPYTGCVERHVERTFPLLFVVGSSRSGCPGAGASLQVVLDGATANVLTYTPGGRPSADIVARGDSMRMYGSNVTGGRINGVECAVIRPHTGALIPEGFVRVFILSEEVRAGCGAPGRTVRLYIDGVAQDPTFAWRAGQFNFPDVPEFRDAREVVSPPNTGSGPVGGSGMSGVTPLALISIGTLALLAGFAISTQRRRVR
jgi:hypothetical protein